MFSCGTEAADWMEDNCRQCKRFNENPDESCPVEVALTLGFFGPVQLSAEQIAEYGLDGKSDCAKLDQIPEDK